jgi:hypothetical protein
MDIFITWSGPRSFAVAEALNEYLPMIVNAFKPWLSKKSIDKGANWGIELTNALANARAGIICLTPSNLAEPWILFEAGAIAKSVAAKPLACTLLIGLESIDLTGGPLGLFQATKPTRDELLHLLKTLNKALEKSTVNDAQVEATFDLVWPKLEERLKNLPPDGPAGRPHRTERELLEQLVGWVRSISDGNGLLMQQLIENNDRIEARLAGIEVATSVFDKYIYEAAARKVKLSTLGSANSYAGLFGKSDAEKIIDEALSKEDLAGAYGAAAKVLSGEETGSGSQVSKARVPSISIRNRRTATKARTPKENT